MSFFKKLFGKSNDPSPSETPDSKEEDKVTGPILPQVHTLEELLEPFAAIGYEKQLRFQQAIGNLAWEFDMQKGKIKFDKRHSFPAQIIGTFSKSQETFMWSWANIHSGIPEHHLKQAKAMKSYGEDQGIVDLFEDSFKVDLQFLHVMGMIAVGMFRSSCYYLADYGQGIMLMTMQAPIVDQLAGDSASVMVRVFPEMISKFTVAHIPALTHYLELKGYEISEEGNMRKATKGNNSLEVTFDELGRMTKLTGGEKPAAS